MPSKNKEEDYTPPKYGEIKAALKDAASVASMIRDVIKSAGNVPRARDAIKSWTAAIKDLRKLSRNERGYTWRFEKVQAVRDYLSDVIRKMKKIYKKYVLKDPKSKKRLSFGDHENKLQYYDIKEAPAPKKSIKGKTKSLAVMGLKALTRRTSELFHGLPESVSGEFRNPDNAKRHSNNVFLYGKTERGAKLMKKYVDSKRQKPRWFSFTQHRDFSLE